MGRRKGTRKIRPVNRRRQLLNATAGEYITGSGHQGFGRSHLVRKFTKAVQAKANYGLTDAGMPDLFRPWDCIWPAMLIGGYHRLLRNFCMMLQNVYLVNDTILNISNFGKRRDTARCGRRRGQPARHFIMALPNGYDHSHR